MWETELPGATPLTRLRFTPDGSRLAVACADGAARFLEAASGTLVATWKVGRNRLTDLRFSRDGRLAAMTDRDGLGHVWSVHDGRPLHTLRGHVGRLNGVAFSPDARYLVTGGADKIARLWDVATGARIGQQALPDLLIWALDLSPDGDRIVAAGVKGLTVWRARASMTESTDAGHETGATSVTFDLRGTRLITGANDRTVRVWDRETGRVSSRLPAMSTGVTGLALGPDGTTLAAGEWKDSVHLWDLGQGKPVDVIRPVLGGVGPLAFTPDGGSLVITAGWKALERWRVNPLRREWVSTSFASSIQNLAMSPDGRRAATVDRTGTLRSWDLASGKPLGSWPVHAGEAFGLRYTPDGRTLISCGIDRWVRGTSAETGVPVLAWRLPAAGNLLDLSRDGRWLAVPLATGETVVAATDGTTQRRLAGAPTEANGAAFSPDGQQVATTHVDGSVRLWDVATGRPAWRGAGILRRPLAALTHRGLEALAGDAGGADPSFERHVREHARLLAQSVDGTVTCVVTWNGVLERWSGQPVTRTGAVSAAGATHVVTWRGGCVVRAADAVVTLPADLLPRVRVPTGLRSVTRQGDRLLLLGQARLVSLDGGLRTEEREVPPATRSVAFVDGQWLLGLRDGRVESLRAPGVPAPVSFGAAVPSPILLLRPIPGNLLAACHDGGTVSILGRRDGREVDRLRVHGAIRSLEVTRTHLVILSDLGDHRALDLTPFRQSRCDLLRDVWRRVSVVWRQGHAVLQPPPADHPCLRQRQP